MKIKRLISFNEADLAWLKGEAAVEPSSVSAVVRGLVAAERKRRERRAQLAGRRP